MIISFFSNFLNHHQLLLAEELNRLTNGQFYFIEVMKIPDWLINSGYPYLSSKEYVIQAWKNDDLRKKALNLALKADVALFAGPEVLGYEKIRVNSTNKLSFDISERWLKRGILNLLSPNIIKMLWTYNRYKWKDKNVYKLCSSAYTSCDQYKLNTYKNKCYRWGYFTAVPEVYSHIANDKNRKTIKLMWCARFLRWKHPEIPVKLAKILKERGYDFILDMYGTGVQMAKTKKYVSIHGLDDVVIFHGNKPNAEILKEMESHDIFLFTSDKNEGWGAVANEAMSQGCVVIGSNEIGSIPFLVNHRYNGLIFRSKNIDSLVENVVWLLQNPEEISRLSKNAYVSMRDIWSPQNAAENLLQFINDLEQGKDSSIKFGPCSKI